MFMDTPTNPLPPIRSRVLRVRHICASIKAPGAILLRGNLVAVAEERPDGVGAACVAWVVLL